MRFKLLESKEDIQRFQDKFGKDIYDTFVQYKDRIKKFASTDLTYHTKYTTIEQMKDIVKRAANNEISAKNIVTEYDIEDRPIPQPTNTKRLLYNKDGYKVYFVTDVEDMIDLSSNKYSNCIGKWCIAGRYQTDGEEKVSQAVKFFKDHLIEYNLDGFYVVLTPNTKFCIIIDDCHKKYYIYDEYDRQLSVTGFKSCLFSNRTFTYPEQKLYDVIRLPDWNKQIYYWNGKDDVPGDVVNVIVNDGVEEIYDDAFNGVYTLKSIKLPESIEYINEYAFYDCSSLSKIEIPKNVNTIEYSAFALCVDLQKVIFSPDSKLETIETGAFRSCESLQEFIFTNPLSAIEDRAFDSCESLRRVVIPNVARIGNYVFSGCDSLQEIVLPIRVKDQLGRLGIYESRTKVIFVE